MRLVCLFFLKKKSKVENIFSKGAILKMYFLREQFFKIIFCNAFFEGAIWKIHFLREQF